jgi:hypothetical protein
MREFLRDAAGFARRFAAPVLPALAGMALVSLGAAFIYLPAGLIVAGLLCLLVDSRL